MQNEEENPTSKKAFSSDKLEEKSVTNIEKQIIQKEPEFKEYYEDAPTDLEELEKYITSKVKLRWSRVFILSVIISTVIALINILVVWIIHFSNALIKYWTPWFFFIECGLLLIFGGCVGTTKQSFTLDKIKVRFFKGENITGADTKIALGSAYTWIFTGVFLGLASLIAWLIVR
ncbi:MAG TPA: hypothetical protein VMX55_02575 [candidate division Zixibacteria bacterium]|nr:hypothetical protein [candidate division Zixibacteria bacterium]